MSLTSPNKACILTTNHCVLPVCYVVRSFFSQIYVAFILCFGFFFSFFFSFLPTRCTQTGADLCTWQQLLCHAPLFSFHSNTANHCSLFSLFHADCPHHMLSVLICKS